MTNRRKRRARQKEQPRIVGSRPFLLPERPFTLLAPEQIEQIHAASLKILARTGVVFNEATAVAHFRQAGARVEGNRVYLEPELIRHCLASTPAQYTLHARNPAQSVTIGGRSGAVMPGGGPPFVRDLDGVRRPGTLADMANFARLSQLAPDVHVVARKAVEAQDIDPRVRHLRCWYELLTLTDKPGQSGFVNGRAEAEDVLQMLAIVFGGEAAIDGTPVAHCSVNANSPLLYDTPMLESLLLFARYGQPILITPFVMAGVTGPVTLAGALAQHNAEVLAGLCLVQLVRPGTPVLYGTATSNVDLHNGNPAIGSPESAQSIAICAQLARFYHLPCRGGGALTDSPIPDGQSQYERMMTLLMSALSGVHYLMHGLGVLESYLTLSYAQFVLDWELLAMVRHILQPVTINEDTLALDTIDAVGPGGHFLDAAHTLARYRAAHFQPQISIRRPFEQWQEQAATRCRELLASYEKPEMDTAVADQLHHFVQERAAALSGKN
ncbi:MAG: trimethylamine methyltransferase family protein [Anaerolineae bacterium]